MITNNHSWSLGSCSNKSFEPALRSETPVRPLRPGDHPFSSTQSNYVHRQNKIRLPIADCASQHRSTFYPSLPSENSSFSFANREISRCNYLISRVCTTLPVNEIFFCAGQTSRSLCATSAPLKPAKNGLNHIKSDKNHLAVFASNSLTTTNHINQLFQKKQGVQPVNARRSHGVFNRVVSLKAFILRRNQAFADGARSRSCFMAIMLSRPLRGFFFAVPTPISSAPSSPAPTPTAGTKPTT